MLAIDFALKVVLSLSKWMLRKGADTVSTKAIDMAKDKVRKQSISALEKSDHEILRQAVEIMKTEIDQLKDMMVNQARMELNASISHVERGLILILVSDCNMKSVCD